VNSTFTNLPQGALLTTSDYAAVGGTGWFLVHGPCPQFSGGLPSNGNGNGNGNGKGKGRGQGNGNGNGNQPDSQFTPEDEKGIVVRRTDGPRSLEDVRDATSTLVWVEKRIWTGDHSAQQTGNSAGMWAGQPCAGRPYTDNVRSTARPPKPSLTGGIFPTDGDDHWHFLDAGSSHPTGVNCGFADGHCKFVSYRIDPELWRRLGDPKHEVGHGDQF
jgi:prepilin-type processing-associated H-X9-DG protein